MNLMPLDKLGAHPSTQAQTVYFGAFFPWVRASDGNQFFVKIIHEKDQFIKGIAPQTFPLTQTLQDPTYGEYWSGTIPISLAGAPPSSHWGQPGRYVYRFSLNNPNVGDIDWIIDPFAREHGVGKISAFTLGFSPYQWSPNESLWRIPALADLIVYELNLAEFDRDVNRAIDRLTYLSDLGVNCVEIMPVSDVSDATKGYWGYTPVGYFGVDARFGGRTDFQRFVDAAHQQGIAILLDSVYGHVGDDFPYNYLYKQLHYQTEPFMGGNGPFGQLTDLTKQITEDFVYTVNQHWLECYHVDGFRYDSVPEYWVKESPGTEKFGKLVYATYQYVKGQQALGGAWSRFFSGSDVRLIQCAEQLDDYVGPLTKTYANSTWQKETYDAAQAVAGGRDGAIDSFGFRLGAAGYPESVTMNGDTIKKAPFQYIENHDHQRFVCNFGLVPADAQRQELDDLLQGGDRTQSWFKVQPYLIGLLTSKGVPLIWQGQELCENYWIPEGIYQGRTELFRPMRWDYFYDTVGQSTVSLFRRLIEIRKAKTEFRSGSHYFYNEPERYQYQGVLLFSRWISTSSSFSLVALNFTSSDKTVPFWFPIAGSYTEQLHKNPADQLNNVSTTQPVNLVVPSNYGRIWSH